MSSSDNDLMVVMGYCVIGFGIATAVTGEVWSIWIPGLLGIFFAIRFLGGK